jgi:hypothetical protein
MLTIRVVSCLCSCHDIPWLNTCTVQIWPKREHIAIPIPAYAMVKIGHITDHEGLTISISSSSHCILCESTLSFVLKPTRKNSFPQPFLNLCVQRETGSEAIPNGWHLIVTNGEVHIRRAPFSRHHIRNYYRFERSLRIRYDGVPPCRLAVSGP